MSIVSTAYELKKNSEKLLIGKPLDNVKIYILNTNDKLVPIGITGELCVGGVELGEIENVIREIKTVQEVALILDERNEEQYVCAYIVSTDKLSMTDIRKELKKKLPDYIIPGYMMQIDHIPTNKNGKVDKKELSKIEVKSEKQYVAPKTEREITIIKVFEEVLIAAVKNIVEEQSAFRCSYSDENGVFNQDKYSDNWYVPYIDLSNVDGESEKFNEYESIENMHYCIYGDKLLVKVDIVKKEANKHIIYFYALHSVWDYSATEVLENII
ncbi:AMP-binding enzyme [Clostridium estertheticum]|uniref:AMP-binding enzyme n=1 Tax=Clostridium estertheticum TaxID=238834 RepID=UPI001C0CE0D0|nr:hypothetical protein [Clostridium estertheticum]MBU3072722.1 hypothetical protein [Clostridium estertheticum]MBU3162815.1 hypothetical protein [Clostridium estertheticum]